jgi:hypothetical protein
LSASAWAIPFHEGAAPKEFSARAHHLDLSLPPHESHAVHKPAKKDKKDKKVKADPKGHGSAVTVLSTGPSVAPAIPEPSALLLFGVGCLVARRAISRARP